MSDEAVRNPADEEALAAFHVPAVKVNRFLSTVDAMGVRLAFGEQGPNGPTRFVFAGVLSYSDAADLARLLMMCAPTEGSA